MIRDKCHFTNGNSSQRQSWNINRGNMRECNRVAHKIPERPTLRKQKETMWSHRLWNTDKHNKLVCFSLHFRKRWSAFGRFGWSIGSSLHWFVGPLVPLSSCSLLTFLSIRSIQVCFLYYVISCPLSHSKSFKFIWIRQLQSWMNLFLSRTRLLGIGLVSLSWGR